MQEDARLIRQAKRNPRNFELLYCKYASKVFNYFWYRTRYDQELAEDLTQETFLRAYSQISKYQEHGFSYLTYLMRIARNLLIDHYRRAPLVRLENEHDIPYEIIHDLELASELEGLWRAIESLPRSARDILLMRYQQHMEIADIARVTQRSKNAVKLALCRARKKLAAHPHLQNAELLPQAPHRKKKFQFSKMR